jgi:hypothetical protein
VINYAKERSDQLMAKEYHSIKTELAEPPKKNYFMQSEMLFQ